MACPACQTVNGSQKLVASPVTKSVKLLQKYSRTGCMTTIIKFSTIYAAPAKGEDIEQMMQCKKR
jgi:hypothetical protein